MLAPQGHFHFSKPGYRQEKLVAQGTMNTRYVIVVLGVVIVGGVFWILQSNTGPTRADLAPLSIVFDWTPNTNHTGIYVALANGWYEEEGIDLVILPFGTVSPDILVSEGKADLGISSTEAVVADAAAGAPVVSIAAI